MKLQKFYFVIVLMMVCGSFIAPSIALAAETQATEEIIIAVMDNGWSFTNPYIQSRIWTNVGEIPNNGFDDDRNGYVDDIHGYNTVDENGDVDAKGDAHSDEGNENITLQIQAAEAQYGRGSRLRIMPMKALGTMLDLEEAFAYVQKNLKVKVVCLPLKFGVNNDIYSSKVAQSIGMLYGRKNENGEPAGALTVIAAGNQQRDLTMNPTWPANLFREVCSLTVGGVDKDGNYVGGSNYASDLPLLVKTYGVPTITHGNNFGTSGSCQIGAGMAGVVADYMNLSEPWAIRQQLIASAQKIPALESRAANGAVADFIAATTNLYSFAPPSIITIQKAKLGKVTGSFSHSEDTLTLVGYPKAKFIKNSDLTFKFKPAEHGELPRPTIVCSPKLGGIDIRL